MGVLTKPVKSFQAWLNTYLNNYIMLLTGSGAPTDGTSGTGVGDCGPGSSYIDILTGNIYYNTGTKASPAWSLVALGAGTSLAVINKSGSNIAADKLVVATGLDTTTGKPKIVLADADVVGHEDVYVVTAAIDNNAEGYVVRNRLSAANLNTNSASAAGDPVYLSATAGGFSHTKPTLGKVIPVGFVVVKSATVGQIRWNIGRVQAPIQQVIASGIFTSVGGDATEVITTTGAILGDTCIAWIQKAGATPRTVDTIVVGTDQVTLTMSGDPSTDHKIGYIVLRTQ